MKICNKKWFIVDSEANGNYSPNNEIKFLTNSLESSLCDYSDAYILVTGNVILKLCTIWKMQNRNKCNFYWWGIFY